MTRRSKEPTAYWRGRMCLPASRPFIVGSPDVEQHQIGLKIRRGEHGSTDDLWLGPHEQPGG